MTTADRAVERVGAVEQLTLFIDRYELSRWKRDCLVSLSDVDCGRVQHAVHLLPDMNIAQLHLSINLYLTKIDLPTKHRKSILR